MSTEINDAATNQLAQTESCPENADLGDLVAWKQREAQTEEPQEQVLHKCHKCGGGFSGVHPCHNGGHCDRVSNWLPLPSPPRVECACAGMCPHFNIHTYNKCFSSNEPLTCVTKELPSSSSVDAAPAKEVERLFLSPTEGRAFNDGEYFVRVSDYDAALRELREARKQVEQWKGDSAINFRALGTVIRELAELRSAMDRK